MFNNDEFDTREQFNDIYREYYRKIYRNILYFTGDIQAAEDLTQETFFKLYNNPPGHTNIIGWLSKVSANLSFNYLRNRKVRDTKEGIQIDESEIPIEEAVIKRYEIKMVRKVLDGLSCRDRMCLLLKFSGYKYDEIAEIIKVNRKSVGSMIARSQVKFKELYMNEADESDSKVKGGGRL